ncbi:30S ribosomal protein S4 [Candidatus Gracilibacteria bacterium]|nr:30S ribosomal protein S4 [Candidatus Gracilibacteria bacterium]
MARYTKSKVKLSKKVGKNLFNKGSRSFSAKDDFAKRPYKPGIHGNKRFSRVSQFAKQLLQKQSLKLTYGVMERQMTNIFKKAFKTNGDTGKIVFTNLERRLDNIIYRGGLANSRDQARQLVNHGHFTINDKAVNIPSMLVKTGDFIKIKENKVKKTFWQNFKLEVPNETPSWLDTKKKNQIKVINMPLDDDLPKDINIGAVVEYYSRKVR